MRVVREVEKWWGRFGSLAGHLYIPESKQGEIRQKFTEDVEQKRQAIFYWINTDPLASWRRLIWVLDCMGQAHLADSIRPNAEPLTGRNTMITHKGSRERKIHDCCMPCMFLSLHPVRSELISLLEIA